MRTMPALVYALAALGCSGTTTGTDEPPIVVGSGHGACARRVGTFSEVYEVRSGNCGPIPEQIVNVDQDAVSADAGTSCSRSVTESADNCEVTFSSNCAGRTAQGLAKWNREGTYATVVEQVGSPTCSGTYTMVARRQ